MNHATAQPVRFPSRSPHRSETLSGYLDVCRLMARFLRLIDVDIHQEKVQRELFMPSLDRDRAIQLANAALTHHGLNQESRDAIAVIRRWMHEGRG